MFSALITIAILVLGPTLAYVQSTGWLATFAARSARQDVRKSAVRTASYPIVVDAHHQDWEAVGIGSIRLRPRAAPRIKFCGQERMGRAIAERKAPPGAFAPASLGRPDALGWPLTGRLRAVGGAIAGAAGLHANVLRAVQPWLRGGYLDGSGAGDPADNKHGTLRCRPPTSHLDSTFFFSKIIRSQGAVCQLSSFFPPGPPLSKFILLKRSALFPSQLPEERCI
jgi:hypothetical protein